ncbi:MAG: SIS domain-containing protein, partial [Methanobacteriota archaeon]
MVSFADARSRHPYHMHEMILRQPAFVSETLHRTASVETRSFIGTPRRLVVTGCGTSFHAATYGARVLRMAYGGRADVDAIQAYDLLHGPSVERRVTVVGVSHSGATETTNRALARTKRAGARVLGLCGLPDSSMERIAERVLVLGDTHDRSWANTMSYTTQLAAFAHLAASVGGDLGVTTASVRRLPDTLRRALRCEAVTRRIARAVAARDRVTFLGSGLDDVTALEAALKIRETCSMTASGYTTEQFLHGPFLSLDRDDAIVAMRSRDDGPRAAWIHDALRRVSGYLAAFGDAPGVDVRLPSVPSVLRPIVSVVPMQFIAYHAALARRANPDVMRSDVPRFQPGLELLFSWRPRRASSARSSRPRRRSGG